MAISRRGLLGGGATACAAPLLSGLVSGCSAGASDAAPDGRRGGAITWWDHLQPLAKLHDGIGAAFSKRHGGAKVAHTVYNPDQMGQSLQLARKSRQLPDITTLAGLESSGGSPGALVSRLIRDGWFQPLALPAGARARIPSQGLVEGLNVFDGELYGLPIFSDRYHATLNWFDSRLVERAGGDPDHAPATWDEFRALARRVTKRGDNEVWGWIGGIQFTERLEAHLTELAGAAGAPGQFDPRTGEYAYTSEPYVQALDFLKSLYDDKVLFPSSASLDVRTARSRWAAGSAAMFFDGPWNPGTVKASFPDFLPHMRVGQIPVPEAGRTPVYHGPRYASQLYLSASSRHPELASRLLGELTGTTYWKGLAEGMDQPPVSLGAVEEAEVADVYRQAIGLYADSVKLGPDPGMNNSRISEVTTRMREVRPNLGEITQGVMVGAVDDPAAELRKYQDGVTAERERAIKEARAEGVRASQADWVFPDWRFGRDYQPRAAGSRPPGEQATEKETGR